MLRRVLIANRGEIARRIARTCRDMGIGVAAVFSDADVDSPYVHEADAAVHLPGSSPTDTYLDIDLLIDAARRLDADAVHPGYGFLAENASFAARCTEAGLVFIGPAPEAIERMGSKTEAKRTMADAGVPMMPSAELPDGADLDALAAEVGFPLLVKASAGGGGKAMRIVHEAAQVAGAVESCRREALGAFGDSTVFLERYLLAARHVEVQVFGDTHGNVIHLGERECSVQRRYQKVVEESPSPVVDAELRERMGEAGVAAARAIGYVGAGTVEFLLDADGTFAFLEMNTRLQVEHAVTELVTGLDLVRLQLIVAAGEPLPDELLHGVALRGHAIEVRLYAENPEAGFLPASGKLHRFDVPSGPGIRVDAGFRSGSEVSVHYDPMLAKIIASGPSRAEAAALLTRTLQRSCIDGVATNLQLLVGILRHPTYLAGEATTAFLDDHDPLELSTEGAAELEATRPAYLAAAALAVLERRRVSAQVWHSLPAGFRSTPAVATELTFELAGAEVLVSVLRQGSRRRIEIDGTELAVTIHDCAPELVDLTLDGVRRRFAVEIDEDRVYVSGREATLALGLRARFEPPGAATRAGSLFAPMPGSVVRVFVTEGQSVVEGAELIVLEAMKMEHTIVADVAGTVTSLAVEKDDHVLTGDVLVVVSPDAEEET